MLLNLTKLIHKYSLKITGAIHIGAHHGEEVAEYHANGIKDIILIEPAKPAFNVLKQKFGAHHHIQLYNIACGSQIRRAKMYVETANQGQSNSLLEPGTHLHQYPGIRFNDTEEVDMMPLDALPITDRFNFINCDVQGYEGEVFKGAQQTLKHIDYVYTEVNKEDVYRGCILVDELDALLSDFTRVETGEWVNNAWTDALYIRKSLSQK